MDSGGGKTGGPQKGLRWEKEKEEDQGLASPSRQSVSHPSASQWHPIVFNLASSVRLPPGRHERSGRRGGPKTHIYT